MRAYADRYLNVFFAYRGSAISDVELTIGRQLEDNLTRALAVTLQQIAPEVLVSFLEEIAEVPVEVQSARQASVVLQPVEPPESPVRRLVGISPAGALAAPTFEESPAGSRPDLLLEIPGTAMVLIESKAVGGTDGSQLWRHARAFGLPVPSGRSGRVSAPAEWIQRSWEDVVRWAERADDPHPVGAFLLSELAEYLTLAGVAGLSAAAGRPGPARVAPLPTASPLLEAIAEAAPLDAVAEVCRQLYGDPSSPHYVHGDDETGHTYTTDDSAKVRDLFRSERLAVPPQLTVNRGNVITARRALCIAYGPKSGFMRSIATRQTQDATGKLVGVGADRAVLLGLLAWAWPRETTHAQLLRQILDQAWLRVPLRGLAAPELHEALPAAARHVLEADAAALSASG